MASVIAYSFVNSLPHLCLSIKFMTYCSLTSCSHHFRITEPERPVDPASNFCDRSAVCTRSPGQRPSLHRSGRLSSRHRWMARCECFKVQPVYVCKISLSLCAWSQNWLFLCLQYVLVSVGDAIIASSPAPLCDGERHEIQVTVSGNQTLLLVDGQSGRSEDAEVPVDLLSQSSTFIGGLPGEDTHICIHILQDVIHTVCSGFICTACRKW